MTDKKAYIEAAKIVSEVTGFTNYRRYCCVNLGLSDRVLKFGTYFMPKDMYLNSGWWGISPHTPTPEKVQLARSIALLLMAEMENE